MYCSLNEQMKETSSSPAPQRISHFYPYIFKMMFYSVCRSYPQTIFLSSSPVISKVWHMYQASVQDDPKMRRMGRQEENTRTSICVYFFISRLKDKLSILYGLMLTPSLTVGPEMS